MFATPAPHFTAPPHAAPRRSIRTTARAAAALTLTALSAGLSSGCYTARPLLGPPAPGTVVVAVLNDRGRAAMADSIGPAVDQVEGRVVAGGDSSFTLAMQRTRSFGGTEAPWAGEQLTFRMSSLRALTERRYSRSRSVALAGAIAASVVAFVLTRTLGGSGDRPREGEGPPPNQQ